MDSNLVRRIGFAAVAIPLALAVVWLGGPPLVGLVAVVSVLGTREFFDLARRQGVQPVRLFGFLTAAAFAPLTYAGLNSPAAGRALSVAWPYLTALWLLGLLAWVLRIRSPEARPLTSAAVTALGVLYAGALPAFLVDIRHRGYSERSWEGTWLVFFPLVLTWICDTAAMFAGRAIGGAKLAPVVSPGKTWAGAVAGVAGALLVAPLYHHLALLPFGFHLALWSQLLFAGTLAVVGQVGDLAESLFKREVGVKDSSALIPGHGGILDRFDSLYFVLPAAAVLYRLQGVL
ncbi:MAG: phosphatidate cytidylyltransferase [Gemmatimonadales bacterium]